MALFSENTEKSSRTFLDEDHLTTSVARRLFDICKHLSSNFKIKLCPEFILKLHKTEDCGVQGEE